MPNSESYNAIFTDIIAFIKKNEVRLGKGIAKALVEGIESSRADIETEYEERRDEVKKRLMLPDEGVLLLDRHKCAACFMVAFLKKLDIKKLEDSPATSKLLREKIAIIVGQSILITMLVERGCDGENPNREEDAKLVSFLKGKDNQFVFPAPLCDEGDYTHNWALGLFYDRVGGDGNLPVLSLANILYLIEIHNRHLETFKYLQKT
jgi:hypothetical protein